jgi:hypothetical protein
VKLCFVSALLNYYWWLVLWLGVLDVFQNPDGHVVAFWPIYTLPHEQIL